MDSHNKAVITDRPDYVYMADGTRWADRFPSTISPSGAPLVNTKQKTEPGLVKKLGKCGTVFQSK